MNTSFTLSKHEKLKSTEAIDNLFVGGQSFVEYPIRVVYKVIEECDGNKVAFSCSKRNFKHAVDRNRIKRLMREAYRLNKHKLQQKNFHIIFLYIDRKIQSFQNIEKEMITILSKINQQNP